MEETFYLTDNIIIQNDKYYYHDEKLKKSKIIKNHNWHHLLKDYGWEKLNKYWIRCLNKMSDEKSNNSLFGVLECGSNGDCLFNCISYAIKNITDENYDGMKLREELSMYIDDEIFKNLMETYKISKISGEFYDDWDPENITIDEFKDILKKGGHDYWGDFLILQLLKEFLQINLVILYNNDISNEYYHYPLMYEYNPLLKTVILLYENEIHFKLIGYFNGNKMNTFFSKSNIPKEILKLINYLR